MKRLLLVVICTVLLLSVLLTGCSANIEERTYTKISVDRELKLSNEIIIDEIAIRKAYEDTAWEELKRIDLNSRFEEIFIGNENFRNIIELLNVKYNVSVSGDKLKVSYAFENFFLTDQNFVFNKVSEMLKTEEEEDEFREYYGSIDVIGVG